VVLQATFDKRLDLETVFDFFSDEPWRELPITITGIRLEGQRHFRYGPAAQARHRQALDNLVARHLHALASGEPMAHRLFTTLFRHVCKEIPERLIGYPPAAAHPMRTCIPGVTRLYVDPQGDFYPCEKTNIPGARIGDIDHGIQLARVRHLLTRQVRFCESDCVHCWAARLCDLCLAHFVERGEIRWRAIRRRCREQREKIRLSLERFTHIYDHEPRSAWDHPFSLHRAVAEARRR
jgi:radical SAM protein with 4Fe4S-binding SPASM domain